MENLIGRYTSFMMFGHEPEGCIIPFNNQAYFEEMSNESIVKSSLLQAVRPGSKSNGGSGMFAGIARIAMPFIYPGIKNFGGYGVTNDGQVVIDYWDGAAKEFNNEFNAMISSPTSPSNTYTISNNRHTLLMMSNSKVSAVCVDEYGSETVFKTQTRKNESNTHSPRALVALILAYLLELGGNNKIAIIVKEHFEQMIDMIKKDETRGAALYARALSDDLYCIMAYETETETVYGKLPFDIKAFTNDYSKFDYSDVKVDSFMGDSPFFQGKANKKENNVKTNKVQIVKRVEDFVKSKEYDLGITWPDDVKDLIPTDCNNIILADVAKRSLDALKATWDTKMKFWSYCWYGPSGTGKSTDARALAQVLGFPYYPQALSDNSYADDILVSKTANTSQITKEEYFKELAKYPTVAQAAKNVDDAWFKLVGTKKTGVKIEDYERALDMKKYSLAENAKTFKEVPSPLFLAYTQGGVCELVEANAMKPAQAKVLNSMLDDTAKIYIDGKVYHRHPNFILIATMNCDEGTEGVHTLSRDFVQRFQVGEMYKGISDSAIAKRIKAKTLLDDDSTIEKMIKVYRAMEKICLEEGDSHDFVGLRQIYNWAQLTAVTKKPYQSGLSTMVGLGTFSEDFAHELESALLTQFSTNDDE